MSPWSQKEAEEVKKGSARQWTEEQLAKAKRSAAASSYQSDEDDDDSSDGDDDENYEKTQDALISKLRSNLEKQARPLERMCRPSSRSGQDWRHNFLRLIDRKGGGGGRR